MVNYFSWGMRLDSRDSQSPSAAKKSPLLPQRTRQKRAPGWDLEVFPTVQDHGSHAHSQELSPKMTF
jgi:hypothetical protein